MASTSPHLRIVIHDSDGHRPISGVRVVAAAHCLDGATVPLGLLDTDAAGYVSFDLLPLLGRSDIDSLWVAPLADLQQKTNVLATDTTAPTRGGRGNVATSRGTGIALSSSIFVEIGLAGQIIPFGGTAALPSVQNPTIDDWRFSPSSFAISAPLPLGQDNCEQLFPSTLPLSEFRFRQMIRGDEAARIPVTGGGGRQSVIVRKGTVFEYKTTWNSLGHSLGQIIHSLPLAPCEQVNVAIINWSRKNQASRDDDLTVKEQLLHNLHRDRSIEESVTASLHEWQHGGNITGGAALSFGVVSAALGGSYSTSSGDRDLAANTAQQLSDNIAQATTSVRSLHSTVVVQSNQQESQEIQIRTVTNHNHCHALTILYYEVLRHFQVITRWDHQRPALFVQYPIFNFDEKTILQNRVLVQSVLLDSSLVACFDALQKLACLRIGFDPSLIQDPPDQREMVSFEVIVRTGDPDTDAFPFINLGPTAGPDVTCSVTDPLESSVPQTPNILPRHVKDASSGILAGRTIRTSHEENIFTLKPDIRITFGDLKEIVVGLSRQGGVGSSTFAPPQPLPWKIEHLVVKAASGDVFWQLYNGPMPVRRETIPLDGTIRLPVMPIGGAKTPESLLTPDERCCIQRLTDHLNSNGVYYSRAIWLNEDADARAVRFEALPFQGTTLIDAIENRILGSLGDFFAFPAAGSIDRNDPVPDPVVVETLLSMPVRGVFAEAKLSHCNACEEKDITRFWDWQTSPCPESAPAISDVKPLPPGQPVTVTPATLPSAVVSIVSPPAAPDPTGLGAALTLLGKGDVFRDMSGKAEVAALLEKLAAGTMSADAAQKEAQRLQGSGALDSAGKSGSGSKPAPGDQHDQLQVLRNAEQHGDITAQQRQKYAAAMFDFALSGNIAVTAGPPSWPDASTSVATTSQTYLKFPD